MRKFTFAVWAEISVDAENESDAREGVRQLAEKYGEQVKSHVTVYIPPAKALELISDDDDKEDDDQLTLDI